MILESLDTEGAATSVGTSQLAEGFRAIEHSARSDAAQSLISANRFLVSRIFGFLKNVQVEFPFRDPSTLAELDTDLLWLDALGEAETPGSFNEGTLPHFREAISVARPEERPFVAFLPTKHAPLCIVAHAETVKLSAFTLRTTGLTGLNFRELKLQFHEHPDRPQFRLAGEAGKELFYQIAAERWLLFSAIILGLAQSAFDYILDYSRRRVTFGKAIGHHQAVALKLADMAIALESSRLLCREACSSGSSGLQFFRRAEPVWHYVKDIPREVAPQMVQVMGGHGYLQIHPVQQWFCDLQLLSLLGEIPGSLAPAVEHD
jgi:Acyl-CoA dehydrogenase, C-terminal domain